MEHFDITSGTTRVMADILKDGSVLAFFYNLASNKEEGVYMTKAQLKCVLVSLVDMEGVVQLKKTYDVCREVQLKFEDTSFYPLPTKVK